MSNITLRLVKGTPLTNQEVDDNFANLNTDKYEAGDSASFQDVTLDNMSGPIAWNVDDGTLDVPLNASVTLQMGQEFVFYAKATEAISNGDVVMFAGAQGGHLLISKCNMGAVGFDPTHVVGIATQDFATNDFGYVTSIGKVRDLDTTAYAEGTVLYVDPTTAGGYTSTKPSSPNHIIQIAAVVRSHGTHGTLLVRTTHMPDTDEVPEGSTNLYFTGARATTAIKADADWNASDWDTAYGWGNHASAGYLTSHQDISGKANKAGDTFTGRVYIDSSTNDKFVLRGSNSPSIEFQNDADAFRGRVGVSELNKEIRLVGQDPENVQGIHILGLGQNGLRYSPNNGLTQYNVWHSGDFSSTKISNWDTAYGWGNHASAGYLTSHQDISGKANLSGDTFTGPVTFTEQGSTFKIDPHAVGVDLYSSGNLAPHYQTTFTLYTGNIGSGTQRLSVDSSGNLSVTGTFSASGYNKTNWDTAYGWGNHASAGYLTSFDITAQTDSKYLRSDVADTTFSRVDFRAGITSQTIDIGVTGDRTIQALSNDLTFGTYGDLHLQHYGGDLHAVHGGGVIYDNGSRVFSDRYHPNADKWTTARTITLSGDLNGSVSIDGSSNVTLSAQVVNDSHTHDTMYQRFTSQTIDLQGLDESTYYPVGVGLSSDKVTRLGVRVGLNSSSDPSWATHSGGFTSIIEWSSNGSGWGTSPVHREVYRVQSAWNSQTICGGIAQAGNSSTEIIYLRGGGRYHMYSDTSSTFTAYPTGFSLYSQTYNPRTTVLNNVWSATTSHKVANLSSLNVGSTEVIDSSRNLNNIGAIQSGTIGSTATNNILKVMSTGDSQFIGLKASYLDSSSLAGYFRYSTGDAQLYIDNAYPSNGGEAYSNINFRNGSSLTTRMQIKGNTGRVNVVNGLELNGTTVIDSNSNLTNIASATASGTISVNRPSNGNAIVTKTGSIINFQVENYTTQTTIRSDTDTLYFWQPSSGYQMKLVNNGAVSIAYDGLFKLATDTSGVTVTGRTNSTTGYQVNGTTVIDSARNLSNVPTATLTSSNPLQFTGAGSNTYTLGAIYCNSSGLSIEAPLETNDSSGAHRPITLTWRGGYSAQGGLQIRDHITEVHRQLKVRTDNQAGYVQGAVRIETVDNYRGAGVFLDNTAANEVWYAGTPYSNHNGYYMIGYASGLGTDAQAQLSYYKLRVDNAGNVSAKNSLQVNGTTVIDVSRNISGVNLDLTGRALIWTNTDAALVLRQGQSGHPWNYIEFRNSANERNWYTGTDSSGNYVMQGETGSTGVYTNRRLTAEGLTSNGVAVIDSDHGNTRLQLKYKHAGVEDSIYSGHLTLWTSEPGITYENCGIGGNINVGGQHYGRQINSNPYGVYLRFDVNEGFSEFWSTTGAAGTTGGKGSRVWLVKANGDVVQKGNLFLDTGTNYQRTLFNHTSALGNGTLEISPETIPGSGTANYYTHFKNKGTVGSGGATKHNVRIDGDLQLGGSTVIDSGRNAIGFVDIKGSGSYHEFGNAIGSVINDGNWNARLNLAGSSHARLDVKSVSDGIITSIYSHTGNGNGRMGTLSNHPLGLMVAGTVHADLKTNGRLNTSSGYEVGGTTVIDSSRNLTNINNANLSRRLTITSPYGGDGSWTSNGILIKNTAAPAGEPNIAFQNAIMGSNFWIVGLNQDNEMHFSFGPNFGDSHTKIRIDKNGRFGIGTSASHPMSNELTVNGTIQATNSNSIKGIMILRDTTTANISSYIKFQNANGLTTYGRIYRSGGSMVYATTSDYRLKENVIDLTDASARISQLPVRRFNFIEHPDITVDGFLAHEVQAVVPEAVFGEHNEVDEEGNPVHQGIDQSKLVPLLTAGLQEALAEIENLKARLSALEN